MLWGSCYDGNQKQEEILMKTKRLLFISCLAAGALIASPSFGKPAKKSAGMSQSKVTRVAPHTTQVMRNGPTIKTLALAWAAPATTAEPVTWHPLLRGTAIQRDALLRRHTLLRQLLRWRHRLLLRRIRLPVLQLLFRLAVLELGLRHIVGILPVLDMGAVIHTVVTTITTRTTGQPVLHANVRL